MNNPDLTDPAPELLELIQSSEVLKSIVDGHPDLRKLLIQAAEAAAAKTSADLTHFLEVVARAAHESDVAFALTFNHESNRSAELAEQNLRSEKASEDLGRLLKQLCPSARPIVVDAIRAATN